MKAQHAETLIIGGGFYGLSIALFLSQELKMTDIKVIEKESNVMERASYINQARIHNGYHYPRSILTAHRSAVNFPLFVDDFKPAVVSNFDKYYAISRTLSKVNARQFVEFCHKIGADIMEADDNIIQQFASNLTEGVFKVKEYAFDARKLRNLLLKNIKNTPAIEILNSQSAKSVKGVGGTVEVETSNGIFKAKNVINCAYSQINTLHRNSDLPLIPMKHEIAQMCLVELPEAYRHFSVTVMDGPFFSIMPFPSRGLHSLSHVRYTPLESWRDDYTTSPARQNPHDYFSRLDLPQQYKKMHADVVRYIPVLKNMKLVGTISDVKSVLVKSENDDSRPILFKPNFGLENYTCIMGGKLDNIYDVFEELKQLYAR